MKRICQEGKETLNSGWVYVGSVRLNNSLAEQNIYCEELESAAITNIGADFVTIAWVESPASPNPDEIQYNIRYRETFPPDLPWTEFTIYNGNNFTVSNLVLDTQYEFEIRVDPPVGAQCEWINLGNVRTGIENPDPNLPTNNNDGNSEITLPPFNCGDDFIPPNLGNTSPLASAQVGDIFMIGGFSILLKEISGGGGVFSGEGVVPLPFDSKVMKVEFQNISVNTDYEVFNGEVLGISDNPANYPSFDPNTITVGGEICQELPTEP